MNIKWLSYMIITYICNIPLKSFFMKKTLLITFIIFSILTPSMLFSQQWYNTRIEVVSNLGLPEESSLVNEETLFGYKKSFYIGNSSFLCSLNYLFDKQNNCVMMFVLHKKDKLNELIKYYNNLGYVKKSDFKWVDYINNFVYEITIQENKPYITLFTYRS